MLKGFLQKFLPSIMTKISNEVPVAASSAESALHSVQSGRIEKADSAPDAPKNGFKRIKQRKYAMLLSYQGKEYFGMQLQKEHPTIESNLLDAMHKLGWITDEQRAVPYKFYFQRAARTDRAVSAVRQICGMQLPTTFDYEGSGVAELNKLLPDDIRAMGIRRTTQHFHPQKQCDARTYSYTLPTFAFAKPHELTNADFRITKETIDEVNSLLDIYLGTHNFFNYTSRKAFGDASCHRYIMSFQCGEPFLYKDALRNMDVEFITLKVKGQSFILHQIRKMVGMVITVVRELQMKSYIQKSFEDNRVDVPKAPGLGLLLERVHYDFYDKKYPPQCPPLTNWGEEIEAAVEKVNFELITKEILETEITAQSMLQWLADLPRHDFSCNPESDEVPKKTFLTMAVAQISKDNGEAEKKTDSEVKTENEVGEEGTSEQEGDEEKKAAVA